MPEVASTFQSTEQKDERADGPDEDRDSPRGDSAQQSFHFAIDQLDGVKVGRVLWKVTNRQANAGRGPGTLRCPESILEEMHAETEPITRNPSRIHDRGSTGRMC